MKIVGIPGKTLLGVGATTATVGATAVIATNALNNNEQPHNEEKVEHITYPDEDKSNLPPMFDKAPDLSNQELDNDEDVKEDDKKVYPQQPQVTPPATSKKENTPVKNNEDKPVEQKTENKVKVPVVFNTPAPNAPAKPRPIVSPKNKETPNKKLPDLDTAPKTETSKVELPKREVPSKPLVNKNEEDKKEDNVLKVPLVILGEEDKKAEDFRLPGIAKIPNNYPTLNSKILAEFKVPDNAPTIDEKEKAIWEVPKSNPTVDEKENVFISVPKNAPTADDKISVTILKTENVTVIPFVTETRENPDLIKGETKVITNGVKGKEVTEKTVVKSKKDNSILLSEDKVIERVEPVNEVIEIGISEKITKQVTETETVPFNEVIEYSDELYVGDEKVTNPGTEGTKTITYSEVYLNDKLLERVKVNEEVTTPPVDKVILRGTKEKVILPKIKEIESEVNRVLPFETIIEYDKNLAENETVIVNPGKEGTETVRIVNVYIDDVLNETKEVVINRIEPENKVVKIGSGINTSSTITEEVTIPFDTVEKRTDELLEGTTDVESVGEDGTKEITYTVNYFNGEEVNRIKESEVITKDPKDKVVLVGTGHYNYEDVIETESVPFNETTVMSDEYEKGTTFVKQEGAPGTRTKTYNVKSFNGDIVSKTLVSNTITLQPKDKITIIGTKDKVRVEKTTEKETVPFKVVSVNDLSIKTGETLVENPGKDGENTYEIIKTYTNDVLTETSRNLVKSVPAENKVIKVGTGVYSKTRIEEREEIKYNLVYENDPTILSEQFKDKTNGENGVRLKVYEVETLNGKQISKNLIENKVEREPRNRVVLRGTGEYEYRTESEFEKIPFDTKYSDSDDVLIGKIRIVKPGTEGRKEIIYRVKYFNNEIISREKVNEIILVPAEDKVVLRGTKRVNDIVDFDYLKSEDLGPLMGIEANHRLNDKRVVIRTIVEQDKSLEEIARMSDKERFDLANENKRNYIVYYNEPNKTNLRKSDVPISEKVVKFVEEHLDFNKLNKEMLDLVNAERRRLNLNTLEFNPTFKEGVERRSKEQADIGNLRSYGKPHHRPNHTPFRTAFEYLNTNEYPNATHAMGENIAQQGVSNYAQLLSEKYLAKLFYEQWRDSPGHYRNMTDPNYKYIAFSVKLNTFNTIHNQDGSRYYLYPAVIGTQAFATDEEYWTDRYIYHTNDEDEH